MNFLVPRTTNKEFAFTKLLTCGLCGSAISADEKFKKLKDGSVHEKSNLENEICKSFNNFVKKYILQKSLTTNMLGIVQLINKNYKIEI